MLLVATGDGCKGSEDKEMATTLGRWMISHSPGYIEHGMGRTLIEGRDEHHLPGIQWVHEPWFEAYQSSLGRAFFQPLLHGSAGSRPGCPVESPRQRVPKHTVLNFV